MPSKYPATNSKDLSRIHLLGFQFAGDDTDSPFNARFGQWALLPYMDLFSDDVKRVLYTKNLLLRLVPIFAKHTRVTGILNKLIGIALFTPDEKKGMIEELADALIEEDESRKTLFTRIEKAESNFERAKHAFQGVTVNYESDANRPKFDDGRIASGTVVAVEGVLNRVSSLTSDPITADRFSKAGVEWLISDDPFFRMGQHNPLYLGNPIALRFPVGLLEAASVNPPFSPGFLWYPYTTVVGVYQENWSAKAPGIRTLEVHWVRIRRPRDPNDRLEEDLTTACQERSWRRDHREPFYKSDDETDCLFALYLMMFTYAFADAAFSRFSLLCAQLSQDLKQGLSTIPKDLSSYFGW